MEIKVGDRVGYSKSFLRSNGQYTGNIPFAKGTVERLEKVTEDFILAHVDWNEECPIKVNVKNLAIIGSKAWAD